MDSEQATDDTDDTDDNTATATPVDVGANDDPLRLVAMARGQQLPPTGTPDLDDPATLAAMARRI